MRGKPRVRDAIVVLTAASALVAVATAPGAPSRHHPPACPRHVHHRAKPKPIPLRCLPKHKPVRRHVYRVSKSIMPVNTTGSAPNVLPPARGDFGDGASVQIPPGIFTPPGSTSVQPPPPTAASTAADPSRQARTASGLVDVIRNFSLKSTPGMEVASSLGATDGGEQSVATSPGGRYVLYTSNRGDAVSTDGGRSFEYLDPKSAFGGASAPAGGFCCDQVVAYMPRTGRFVWVLQYWTGLSGVPRSRGTNVIRVAVATLHDFIDSGGKKWTPYDFSPGTFGFATVPLLAPNLFLDRPSISFTRQWLYITADVFRGRGSANVFNGTVAWRLPSTLGGGPINSFLYLRLPRAIGKVRPAQTADPNPRFQWFAGTSSTSMLDVIRWSTKASGLPAVDDPIPVGTIATKDTSSKDPLGRNWMARFGKQAGVVQTGAQLGDSLLFGWMYGRAADVKGLDGQTHEVTLHNQPGIGFALLNDRRFPPSLVAMPHIEYADLAAALPQVRLNTNGNSAISFMFGGPSRYPSHAVGFLIGYAGALTVQGTRSAQEPNYGGDYVGLANIPGTQCFAAAGSATKLAVTLRSFIDPHYIMFGRPSEHCKAPLVPRCPAFCRVPGPDLTVDSIGGGFGAITIDVKNAGDAAAGASKLSYNFNGGEGTLLDVPALSAGQADTEVVDCPASGAVTVNATADATNLVSETDESNNSNSVVINCHARPPANLPDLIVDRVYGDPNSQCTVFADIRNIGGVAAPASKTEFKDLNNPSTFDQLIDTPPIAAGAMTTVQLPRSFGQNDYARVTADATGVVAESNEDNNTASGFGEPSTNGNCHFP